MGQAFQMISGPSLNELLTKPDNRLAQLLSSPKSDREIIEELYWTALTRAPNPVESRGSEQYIARVRERRDGLEDLAWSLMNAKEFVLRR